MINGGGNIIFVSQIFFKHPKPGGEIVVPSPQISVPVNSPLELTEKFIVHMGKVLWVSMLKCLQEKVLYL